MSSAFEFSKRQISYISELGRDIDLAAQLAPRFIASDMNSRITAERSPVFDARTIYKVRSPRQTAENNVKHPEVRRKKMSLDVGILHEDRQTGITVWE